MKTELVVVVEGGGEEESNSCSVAVVFLGSVDEGKR